MFIIYYCQLGGCHIGNSLSTTLIICAVFEKFLAISTCLILYGAYKFILKCYIWIICLTSVYLRYLWDIIFILIFNMRWDLISCCRFELTTDWFGLHAYFWGVRASGDARPSDDDACLTRGCSLSSKNFW